MTDPTEWERMLEYSREQRKAPWDRTGTAQPEYSDEYQRIMDAGINRFEAWRLGGDDWRNLPPAERNKIPRSTS